MKNLATVFLFMTMLAIPTFAIQQDPTPAQIDSLVRPTMAVNPWLEMAIPPESVIRIPTPDGYATCYIWEWDNGMGMPACYWQACEAELRFQFCLARFAWPGLTRRLRIGHLKPRTKNPRRRREI